MRSTVGIPLLPAQAVAEGQGGGGCQRAHHYPKGCIVKPYAYRRWRICYVTARASGYSAPLAAFLAFVAMSKIEIRVKD